MPHEDKARICQSYQEVECLIAANRYWTTHKTSNTNSIKPCDCLDTCRNVEYFVRFKKVSELLDPMTNEPFHLLKK